MSNGVHIPTVDEKDNKRQNVAIRQLAMGRSNATGTVTLTANAATTTVEAEHCTVGSIVNLTMPQTANAAAAIATTYIAPATVTRGQFIITHANNAQTDRTFGWEVRG